jgi:hypothetical protein
MPFDANKKEDCRRWLDAEPDNYDSTEWYDDENALALAWATWMTAPCKWTWDKEEHSFDTSCGNECSGWTVDRHTGMFCPYCAHCIEEVPYEAEEVKETKE